MSDPLTSVLLQNEVPVDPPAAFADALLDRCLHELRPRRRRALVVSLAFVATLIVAGAATATYLATRHSAAPTPTSPAGALTLSEEGGKPQLSQITVVVDGRQRVVWRCPHETFCGTLSSIAWSPDGRHLAMTLGEIGGTSGYVGLHVIDVATRADHHLGVPPIPHPERTQSSSVLDRLFRASVAHLGCGVPFELAWSPDSQHLAYACGDDLLRASVPTVIYTIRRDGTGRRRLPTGTASAYEPSWSADGTRIAFATKPYPRMAVKWSSPGVQHHFRGQIYSVGLDGSDRVLVARDAAQPAYSPDGRTIAFATTCGIRTAPVGAPTFAEPTCPGPYAGWPSWSPDGSTIAFGSRRGIQLMTPDGRITGNPVGAPQRGPFYLLGGPEWAPQAAIARLLAPRGRPGY
jgi:dipeptidyl aminopeptidase/acylaminoacyl peptidase